MRFFISLFMAALFSVTTFAQNEATYTLDLCRSIDKDLTKQCRKFLKKNLESLDSAMYGEVLVMDSKTGHLKAWVALENEDDVFVDAQPRKKYVSALPFKYLFSAISLEDAHLSLFDMVDTGNGIDSIGGLMIKDHNWLTEGGFGRLPYKEAFIQHSDIAMAKALYAADSISFRRFWNMFYNFPREYSTMEIAGTYNIFANDGIVVVPSVNTDSVHIEIDEDRSPSLRQVKLCRELLKANLQEGGIGSKWTTKKVDLAGDYSAFVSYQPSHCDDKNKEDGQWEVTSDYIQLVFAGYLPASNPRYTICVVVDKKGFPAAGRMVSDTVNKLAEYLDK